MLRDIRELEREDEQELIDYEWSLWAEEYNKKMCVITELELAVSLAKEHPFDGSRYSFDAAARTRLDEHMAKVKVLLSDTQDGEIPKAAEYALKQAEEALAKSK
jgi:hypothetical protein